MSADRRRAGEARGGCPLLTSPSPSPPPLPLSPAVCPFRDYESPLALSGPHVLIFSSLLCIS